MDIEELHSNYTLTEQRLYGGENPYAHREFMNSMERIKDMKK